MILVLFFILVGFIVVLIVMIVILFKKDILLFISNVFKVFSIFIIIWLDYDCIRFLDIFVFVFVILIEFRILLIFLSRRVCYKDIWKYLNLKVIIYGIFFYYLKVNC